MGYKVYKEIWEMVLHISTLHTEFSLKNWLEEEKIKENDAKAILFALNRYKEQLELDSHVLCDEEEMKELLAEGNNIYSVIVKERVYGEED